MMLRKEQLRELVEKCEGQIVRSFYSVKKHAVLVYAEYQDQAFADKDFLVLPLEDLPLFVKSYVKLLGEDFLKKIAEELKLEVHRKAETQTQSQEVQEKTDELLEKVIPRDLVFVRYTLAQSAAFETEYWDVSKFKAYLEEISAQRLDDKRREKMKQKLQNLEENLRRLIAKTAASRGFDSDKPFIMWIEYDDALAPDRPTPVVADPETMKKELDDRITLLEQVLTTLFMIAEKDRNVAKALEIAVKKALEEYSRKTGVIEESEVGLDDAFRVLRETLLYIRKYVDVSTLLFKRKLPVLVTSRAKLESVLQDGLMQLDLKDLKL